MKTAGLPPGIAGQMVAEGGEVTFARFMDLALTHPSEGYYSQAEVLLGARGHFSTAPSLSPEFNESTARLIEELVTAAAGPPAGGTRADGESEGGGATAISRVNLVELGGGAGELAEAVLGRLEEQRSDLQDHFVYTMVEVGEHLRARQRERLGPLFEKGWQVTWAANLAEGLEPGAAPVVVGNEFIDALPVHLVDVRGDEPQEVWVAACAVDADADEEKAAEPRVREGRASITRFEARESLGALSQQARAELQTLFGTVEAPALRAHTRDGFIELRSSVGSLFEHLATSGAEACLLTIDYGKWCGAGKEGVPYGRSLRGYYHHQSVDDLYARVGKQDLTADVDFRALDLHGRKAGFETVLYSSVSDLLVGDSGQNKLQALRKKAPTSLDADRRASILAKLLDEQDLGGAFRVLLQVRG